LLDKLDVAIPPRTPLRPPFAEIVADRLRGKRVPGSSVSAHYEHVFDFRRFGADAILHFISRYDRSRPHKLELVETGYKRFSELLKEISSIFEVDPGSLLVKRVDLAVDIDGVSVRWFKHNARVRFKQVWKQIGKMQVEVSETTKNKIETLCWGRSPNVICCYDKVEQLRGLYVRSYSSVLRPYIGRGRNISKILGFSGLELSWRSFDGVPSITIPSFEEEYGISPDFMRTRLERRIAGVRIPQELKHLWKFPENLPKLNPFEEVQFLNVPLDPDLCSLSARDFLMARGLRTLVRDHGYQSARQQLNARSKRNASRIFDRYGEFLEPDPDDGPGISEGELFERYSASVGRQLAS
jgi:hypothetical protein